MCRGKNMVVKMITRKQMEEFLNDNLAEIQKDFDEIISQNYEGNYDRDEAIFEFYDMVAETWSDKMRGHFGDIEYDEYEHNDPMCLFSDWYEDKIK
jgi:hypothetical protein